MTICVQMKVGVWKEGEEEQEKYSLHGYRSSWVPMDLILLHLT